MAKSKNTKVNRLLSVLAAELCGEDDGMIVRVHNLINNEIDGYDFDFIGAVNSYRAFLSPPYPTLMSVGHNAPKSIKERAGVRQHGCRRATQGLTRHRNDYVAPDSEQERENKQ